MDTCSLKIGVSTSSPKTACYQAVWSAILVTVGLFVLISTGMQCCSRRHYDVTDDWFRLLFVFFTQTVGHHLLRCCFTAMSYRWLSLRCSSLHWLTLHLTTTSLALPSLSSSWRSVVLFCFLLLFDHQSCFVLRHWLHQLWAIWTKDVPTQQNILWTRLRMQFFLMFLQTWTLPNKRITLMSVLFCL